MNPSLIGNVQIFTKDGKIGHVQGMADFQVLEFTSHRYKFKNLQTRHIQSVAKIK